MPLTLDNYRYLENFGHSLREASYYFRPAQTDEICEVLQLAGRLGLTVTARGAGRSYSDAALNGGGIILDLAGLNRILSWDPATGVIQCEPGVTLEQLWKTVEPEGWWPPVVSGTMKTTLGGCLAANIHGKNNFQKGPIGEHVLAFTALLTTGESVTCTPEVNPELFHAMIGGLGMLGIFTSVTLRMRRIYSGLLTVEARPVRDLDEHLQALLLNAPDSDYIVGWLDTTAGGRQLGRGQIHSARNLREGEDPNPGETMSLASQSLPSRLLGLMPKSSLHFFMRPFVGNAGAHAINTAKYLSSLRRHTFRQSHAAFHFLLDYVPNWERAYGRGGLIQYQSFLPAGTAAGAWRTMIGLSQRRGLPSYLGVTKRHRPDRFLLTHAVDGFSLALDFKVTEQSRPALRSLLREFDEIALQAGGRFYFAKNSETTAEAARAFLGEATLARFRELKQRCDPGHILESNLYRRLFG